MNLLLAATLLLASVANINADAADMMVPGLRGVDTADAGAAAADGTGASHSRRQLQNLLGDWAFCTSSSQCQNQCCSSKYSTSDGRLKCTPVGGFKPSEGCVGGPPSPSPPSPSPPSPTPPPPSPTSLKGDWQLCSSSNQCQNGCCSSKYSGGVLKCTPVGGFKLSEGCVGGPPSPSPPTPTPPPPTPTPPTGGGARAYVTYHNYYAGEPLTDVACSDGRYGLMTRWGYSTIDPMAPYVTATSVSGWNSPNCGKCYEVVGSVRTIYLTAIDQCGPGPSGEMHFDIHPQAFRELMGDAGVTAGTGYVTYKEVSSSRCRGNKG